MSANVVRETYSLCPVCKKRIKAQHVRRGNTIFLEKTCPEHGSFSTPIWRGHVDIDTWRGNMPTIELLPEDDCPNACGLCSFHQSGTCCVLIEVTRRCNLCCPYCFANGGQGEDRSFDEIVGDIRKLVVKGQTLLQLSGGEPTVRDDLPEIVREAKKAGCRYVQLNSNGVRLAKDRAFVKALKDAGLSFVFMQFDGVDDTVYRTLRGCDLWDIKQRAIENCAEQMIGVTLVPTVVDGVNDRQVGDILRFAVRHSPAVRGVHFQPVSYFGRTPEDAQNACRYTLDQLLRDIAEQASDILPSNSLKPSRCDHPLCGFHGDFAAMPDGTLYPLITSDVTAGTATAEQNRAFVARRWDRSRVTSTGGTQGKIGDTACCCDRSAYERQPLPSCRCESGSENGKTDTKACCDSVTYEREVSSDARGPAEPVDMTDMDVFLHRVRTHGFTVTAMAFQDAYNVDLERLKRCSLHVYREGKFIPFCMYYL